MKRAILVLAALLTGSLPALAGVTALAPVLCRVVATTAPGLTPGTYTVTVQTRPECPANGYALVRAESGRIYPWQVVTPQKKSVYRGIPWYWVLTWRAASGKKYTIPTPGMTAPWGTP